MFTGATSNEITAFYPSSLDVFLLRFSPQLLTPTDLSHLLSAASQIAAVFQSCLFVVVVVFNDVEHVGVCGQCNG